MDWQENIITNTAGIRSLLSETRTVAVLGIKTDAQATQPAFYVPRYLQTAGFQIIPVPVYYPKVTEILGQQVYRRLLDIPIHVDLVNVFRRSEHIPAHLDEMLVAAPRAVWFQLGIRNDAVAEKLAQAGIDVVQDRCLMVELQRIGR